MSAPFPVYTDGHSHSECYQHTVVIQNNKLLVFMQLRGFCQLYVILAYGLIDYFAWLSQYTYTQGLSTYMQICLYTSNYGINPTSFAMTRICLQANRT
jgi:hypothetical protein